MEANNGGLSDDDESYHRSALRVAAMRMMMESLEEWKNEQINLLSRRCRLYNTSAIKVY
jgi:hypothetical protein